MKVTFSVLGGAEEIGANCAFIQMGRRGFLVDSGLHPKRRDDFCFPMVDGLETHPVEALFLTHAHTDHIGGLPYMLHKFPNMRVVATKPTRDLLSIMLSSTSYLIRFNPPDSRWFPFDVKEIYNNDIMEKIDVIVEGMAYNEIWSDDGIRSGTPLQAEFFDAGHIVGSAGILFSLDGKTVFHTGDVQFDHQQVLRAATFPRRHVDVLFCEATNCASEYPELRDEEKRFAQFINSVVSANGSVLIPAFALGKTQEILTLIWKLMRKGDIPDLPIYSGGMSRSISAVYDRYCYSTPRLNKGFEIGDIPVNQIHRSELMTADYFSKPSIVVASSGMMNEQTNSYMLAGRWLPLKNFGIAIIGYQDSSAPGYAISNLEKGQKISMNGTMIKRNCHLEKFRFTAHSNRENIVRFIEDVRPKHLIVQHGETESCEWLGAQILDRLPQTSVYIPTRGKKYEIEL